MKTILESLEQVYADLQKSSDPKVAVTRRNIHLIIEDLKNKSESGVKVSYFYNEKGDYTITLRDEPIAFTFNESDAIKLVSHVSGLTLRVDVLSKIKTFTLT